MLLAEITLALVLFADSANANFGVLRKVKGIPVRLLLVGLPLTIAAGFGAGWLIFDQLTLFELALLATMLAPTDSALGQAVVTNESVPASVRESLNVESGLNDDICVPVLLIFLGWFGPRGLASIVFVVMVMDEKLPGSDTLAAVVSGTVALSIISHGISAVPFAKRYGKRVADRKGAV